MPDPRPAAPRSKRGRLTRSADFERVFALAMDEADRVDRPYMVYLGCGDNKYIAGARSAPTMLLTPDIELPATDATVLERRAAELSLPRLSLEVPMVNEVAMRHLLARGFQMESIFTFLMSSRPFGRFDRFIGLSPPFVL